MAKKKKVEEATESTAVLEQSSSTVDPTTGVDENGNPIVYQEDDVSEWMLPHKDWVDPIPGRVYSFEHPNSDKCRGWLFLFVSADPELDGRLTGTGSFIRQIDGKDEMEDVENDDGDKIGEEIVERYKFYKLTKDTTSENGEDTIGAYWTIRKRHTLWMDEVKDGNEITIPKAPEQV